MKDKVSFLSEEMLTTASRVVATEISNLNILASQFQDVKFCEDFLQLLSSIDKCRGKILVSGIGKSGLIGKKISAIFSSIGVPSFFIHPVEAVHGDLGCINRNDLLLAISCSGNTEELHNIVQYCNRNNILTSFICCQQNSWLEQNCKCGLVLNMQNEAIKDFPIPTTSSILTLAVCDALTACLVKTKKLTRKKYGQIHCGGSIGKMMKQQ